MLFEDRKLVLKPFRIKVADIAGIAALRDEFERHLLASAADEQGNVWLLCAFRSVDRATHMVILPFKCSLILRPHF